MRPISYLQMAVLFLTACLVSCTHGNYCPMNPRPEQTPTAPVISSVSKPATDNHSTALVLIKEKQINFAANQADISDLEKQDLKQLAALIVKNEKLFNHVEIVGHADKEGSDDNSLNISRKRALSVSEVLKTSGLTSTQILTSWRGNTEPAEKSAAPAVNRRVELKFYGAQKTPDFDSFIEELNKID